MTSKKDQKITEQSIRLSQILTDAIEAIDSMDEVEGWDKTYAQHHIFIALEGLLPALETRRV